VIIMRTSINYMPFPESNLNQNNVFKIGGTSMVNEQITDVVSFHLDSFPDYTNHYVVSAYGAVKDKIPFGETDMLLKSKDGLRDGVHSIFEQGGDYKSALSDTIIQMRQNHKILERQGLDIKMANDFINDQGIRVMEQLEKLDNPKIKNILAGEVLASLGEIHSGYNAANILNNNGIETQCIDLSGFGFLDNPSLTIQERIQLAAAKFDQSKVKILTGYAGGLENTLATYRRGYSEVTAQILSEVLKVPKLVILKEYPLLSADPKSVSNGKPIKQMNYTAAAELSALGMAAVHPSISKKLKAAGIDIEVQDISDLNNSGTLISNRELTYNPEVQMVTGMQNVVVINLENDDMAVEPNYITDFAKVVGKNILQLTTGANNISIVISQNDFISSNIGSELEKVFPESGGNKISISPKSIIAVVGSNLKIKGLLARGSSALSQVGINIDAFSQTMLQSSMQFIVDQDQYENGIKALHGEFFGVEKSVSNSKGNKLVCDIEDLVSKNKSLEYSKSMLVLDTLESDKVREVRKNQVLEFSENLCRSQSKSKTWFETPRVELRGHVPIDFLNTENGCKFILQILNKIKASIQ
jgi:aspartate kinase